MILKTNANEKFSLSMKLDINYKSKYIDVLVIFNNFINNKSQLFNFHSDEFEKALAKYSELEQMIF